MLTDRPVKSLYLRSYVVDGNFKADHLKQKNDDTDVWLTDGEGFMTERSRYEAHLNAAKESTQVIQFPTSNFRLVDDTDPKRRNRHVTAIGRSSTETRLTIPLTAQALAVIHVPDMDVSHLVPWLTFRRVSVR